MIIGGLQKLTLLDYPDHIAAIIFTQGCNFRCHYCYNPKLVVPNILKTQKDYSPSKEDSLFEFLRKRQKKLDAVVVSGGEPTLHKDLPQFLIRIKALGFLIKLDTNGTNPDMLKNVIGIKAVDYIAMDIKAPLSSYEKVVGVKAPLDKLQKSIIIIKESKLPYEFRSTIIPGLHTLEDIKQMGEDIKGAGKWYLQKFKSDVDLVDNDFKHKRPFSDRQMREFAAVGKQYAAFIGIR